MHASRQHEKTRRKRRNDDENQVLHDCRGKSADDRLVSLVGVEASYMGDNGMTNGFEPRPIIPKDDSIDMEFGMDAC